MPRESESDFEITLSTNITLLMLLIPVTLYEVVYSLHVRREVLFFCFFFF